MTCEVALRDIFVRYTRCTIKLMRYNAKPPSCAVNWDVLTYTPRSTSGNYFIEFPFCEILTPPPPHTHTHKPVKLQSSIVSLFCKYSEFSHVILCMIIEFFVFVERNPAICRSFTINQTNINLKDFVSSSHFLYTLTLSQCTLAGPVYTGMPLECHWLTQCTLGHHWAIQRILAGYTGTPMEKISWNSPTLECHWRNLVESAPHWDATGETLTFAAYTGTPLEGLWQPTHAPTHIVKHAE